MSAGPNRTEAVVALAAGVAAITHDVNLKTGDEDAKWFAQAFGEPIWAYHVIIRLMGVQ